MTFSHAVEVYRRRWVFVAALAGAALATGVLAPDRPLLVMIVTTVGTVLALGVAFPGLLPRAFLTVVAVLLVGYAFLARSFAYLGVPPLFIGEIALGIGLLAALLNRRRWEAFRSPVTWLLFAFGLWGALRTLPYLGTYRIDALRDAVVWGYAVFAVLLVPLILEKRLVERIPGWFATCIPWFLIWVPIALALFLIFGEEMPYVPGTEVAIVHVKPGDFGIHLAGIAAFMLLGLHRLLPANSRRSTPARRVLDRTEGLWWFIWLAGFIGVASLNRGGMLAVFVGLAVVLSLRPGAAGRRVVWIGGVVALFVLLMIVFDVSFERRDGRDVSARQVVENALSIAGSGPSTGNLQGTRQWRLLWWNKIIGYTVHGEYFWTGKGYGINLAIDDGFAGRAGHRTPLRSPHNGHLTILARSGVPGAALWLLLQGSFAATLLLTHSRARRRGQERIALMCVWILAYWAAFNVNAAFDVALEGPNVGIWFWSLFGFGLAVVLQQRRAASDDAARPPYRS